MLRDKKLIFYALKNIIILTLKKKNQPTNPIPPPAATLLPLLHSLHLPSLHLPSLLSPQRPTNPSILVRRLSAFPPPFVPLPSQPKPQPTPPPPPRSDPFQLIPHLSTFTSLVLFDPPTTRIILISQPNNCCSNSPGCPRPLFLNLKDGAFHAFVFDCLRLCSSFGGYRDDGTNACGG
ncbi:formin-like protein 7 [Malus sylvestris]|uniref:formin-like protein 7 n=1 Tax=Malus sylvestris TaxID=3752 RepID=UPI0021ABA856|nr:formin-like protein 7 [Malus sylvestris]